jgi:hypothetical protein
VDAGLRLDDLAERPQRHALAVREAAALTPRDDLRVLVDDPMQLVHETTLAEPGHADERDELRRPRGADPAERVAEDTQLLLASDELGASLVRDVDSGARAHVRRLPHPDRLRLALGLDRLGDLVVDRTSRRAVRRLVHDHAVHGSRALQARRRVDDVAGCHPLAGVRSCVERHEHLPGSDPDPQLERLLQGEVADRERRADGALGVVLVRRRSAEQGHDGIADELLHRAAVPLELGAYAHVVRAQDRLHVLGIQRLGPRGEADEVAEEDAHDLPLAARIADHALLARSASPCWTKRVAPIER